ncbi:hypothetical protein [Pedobacter hartonius]|uniref:Uncharacterized protein n=1 Tax=Pedobacter hartonius TaxID=425514 RepID=A0A1H4G810_9SPHI|nr:hypothetical protein [Pedobacter hartonius]SEB05421.1 hypothetical protein SAMN05443550_10985 [Pedobacter hartonius]
MILKLIQSGGFAGRSRFAEEDLSCHSLKLQEYLDSHFSALQGKMMSHLPPLQRDAFQYFVEYKGTRLPVDEKIKLEPEFAEILEMLKSKLHY